MKRLKRLSEFYLGIMILGTLIAGCNVKDNMEDNKTEDTEIFETEDETEDETEEKTEESFEDDTDYIYEGVSESVNSLGYRLFDELSTDGNLCISPYSIDIALAMAANGAGGDTLTEMLDVMNIQDIENFNTEIQTSIKKLENDGAEFSIADSAWYNMDMKYNESFERSYIPVLENYYGADIFPADFSNDQAVNDINQWVFDETNGKISKIINRLDYSTRLLLLNAVYFNGEWELPFYIENTYKQDFYGTDGTKQVDMMHMYESEFQYCCDYGIRVLRLGYKDSDIVMEIMINENPESETTVTEAYNALGIEEKEKLAEEISDSEYTEIQTLALPVFEFSSECMELNDVLMDLGMEKAFMADADLDKIADEVYISEVYHKTYIKVDEQGTEAAAVTIVAANDAAAMPVEDPVNFIVDHPFMYILRDSSDGTILFMGSMNNIDED